LCGSAAALFKVKGLLKEEVASSGIGPAEPGYEDLIESLSDHETQLQRA
jgi:hypothetical protein